MLLLLAVQTFRFIIPIHVHIPEHIENPFFLLSLIPISIKTNQQKLALFIAWFNTSPIILL